MKLRKVEWWEAPKARPKASPAPSPGLTAILPVHTKEVVREVIREEAAGLEEIKKEVAKLKKRKPEYFPGGSGSTGSYHRVTTDEIRFTKSSFQPGVNVIGVASGVVTTVWLPADLEHNHLIAVKDELGIAAQQPIVLKVYT